MNRQQNRMLAAIFSNTVNKTLVWTDIEALLISLGCSVIEGNGSRVKFVCQNHILAVHRPHPRKEAKAYQVKAVREFLLLIGVKP